MKPCIFNIDETIYYVPEDKLLKIPYFHNMYSGRFSEQKQDVDYKTINEYKLENMDIFCWEGCKLLSDILNEKCLCQGHPDEPDYGIMVPIDIVLQLIKLLNFLCIDFEILDNGYVNIDDLDFLISPINPIKDLDQYGDLQLSDNEKDLILSIIPKSYSEYNLDLTKNMENIYPGFTQRLDKLTKIMQDRFEFDNIVFRGYSAKYILYDELYLIKPCDITYCIINSYSGNIGIRNVNHLDKIRFVIYNSNIYGSLYYYINNKTIFTNFPSELACSKHQLLNGFHKEPYSDLLHHVTKLNDTDFKYILEHETKNVNRINSKICITSIDNYILMFIENGFEDVKFHIIQDNLIVCEMNRIV